MVAWPCCHLGFPIGIILAIFYPQIIPILSTKFEPIGLLVQEKKRKVYFQGGGHGSNFLFQAKKFSFF